MQKLCFSRFVRIWKLILYVFIGYETLPYPPSKGDFAVYTIDELVEGVNFAVSQARNFLHRSISNNY